MFIAEIIAVTLTFGVCMKAQSQLNNPENVKGQIAPGGVGDTVKIMSITVVGDGATQTNMRQDFPKKGNQNWGCVKKADSYVEVKVTTQPDTEETWDKLEWNDTGEEVPTGNGGFKKKNYRRYSRAQPAQINVKPTLGGSGLLQLQIWVIWGTYNIGLSAYPNRERGCAACGAAAPFQS